MQVTKTRALAVLALVPMLVLGLMVAGPTHVSAGPAQGLLQVRTVDSITGVVVSGAQVTITNPANPQPIAMGKTDAFGAYSVYLAAGTYRLAIAANNYQPFAKLVVVDPNHPSPISHLVASLDPSAIGPAPFPQPGCCAGSAGVAR